jgi:hypothetical protein
LGGADHYWRGRGPLRGKQVKEERRRITSSWEGQPLVVYRITSCFLWDTVVSLGVMEAGWIWPVDRLYPSPLTITAVTMMWGVVTPPPSGPIYSTLILTLLLFCCEYLAVLVEIYSD